LSKLFTFGCSCTSYRWPTWADILAKEFDEFENWGLAGTGNSFILNSLHECLIKNKISANDTVVIMWTGVTREDHYVNNQWTTLGNVYTNNNYDRKYIEKFADTKGYFLRDAANISIAKILLEHYNIKYHFLSMVPLTYVDKQRDFNISKEILNVYAEVLDSIKISIFASIFNSNWHSKPNRGNDPHPRPADYLEYLDLVLPEYKLSSSTRAWVNEVNNLTVEDKDLSTVWKNLYVERW
jgi:hypothetical protein